MMALIQCPECRESISDQAPACPHCGKPMAAAGGDYARYAVLALEFGPVPDETVECLTRMDCLSRDEARSLLASAPVILVRHMTRRQAVEYSAALAKFCTVKVVDDLHADTVEAALSADAAFTPAGGVYVPDVAPLTFRQTVGAVFLGCALCGISGALFLSIIS